MKMKYLALRHQQQSRSNLELSLSLACSGAISSHPGKTGWFSLTVTWSRMLSSKWKVESIWKGERLSAEEWFWEKPAGKVVLAPTSAPALPQFYFPLHTKSIHWVLALNKILLSHSRRDSTVRWGEKHGLEHCFSTGSGFPQPLPTSGDFRQCPELFLIVTTGGDVTGIYWAEARNVAKHSTVYRTALHNKESSSPKCQ